MFVRSLCLSVLVLGVFMTGCAGEYNAGAKFKRAQFWQRIHASEAIYLTGPKSHQMLNRDIARCVTELRELIRLGVIREAMVMDASGRVMSADEMELENWDMPERDQYLLTEHGDYHDFEGCMLAKGWERVLYMPHEQAIISRDNYLDSIEDYSARSRRKMSRKRDRTYDDLNQ